MKNQPICIIGGMGPQASAYLYNLLIQKAISEFGVKKDEQFPKIVIYSVAVPNFIKSRKNMATTLKSLKQTIKELNKLDILSLSIACNTVHLLLPKLSKLTKVPITSIINEVVKVIIKAGKNRVGILATSTTLQTGLYQNILNDFGIEVVNPSNLDSKKLDLIIENVIAGKIQKADQNRLLQFADSMKKKGAEGIILGCTELPLIFPKEFDLPVYSSLDILAVALLEKYYRNICL